MHSLTVLPAGPAGAQRHGPHPGCPMVCCCRAQVWQQPALSHRHLHCHAQGSSCWRAALSAGSKQGWRPRVFAAARAPEPGAETQCQRRPPGAAQGGRGAAVQGASGGGLPRGPGHCLATGGRCGASWMCYAEHGAEQLGLPCAALGTRGAAGTNACANHGWLQPPSDGKPQPPSDWELQPPSVSGHRVRVLHAWCCSAVWCQHRPP